MHMANGPKRGRPRGDVQTKPFVMRVSADWLGAIDQWRTSKAQNLSRSQAIRLLVNVGLLSDAMTTRRIEQRVIDGRNATVVRAGKFDLAIFDEDDEVRFIPRTRRAR